jgi:anti-anti-sigma factor
LSTVIATPAPGLAVVTLAGRFDAVAAPGLRARLDEADIQGRPHVVFDLAATDFVDSAGLAVLVWQRRTCRAQGGDVVLIRPDADSAMRVFRLTQFDSVFRMLPQRAAEARE